MSLSQLDEPIARRIGYAIARSPFGWIIVAMTERGLCRVAIAATRDALRRDLANCFPNVELAEAKAELAPRVAAIVRHLEGRERRLLLPLDVAATAFQRRVWAALRSIPYGETRSYQDIARAIGAPSAARAVGAACARNPLAIVIPCHRAVRQNGDLANYAWGLDVKRRLLAAERQASGQRKRRGRSFAKAELSSFDHSDSKLNIPRPTCL
jgi:AraC family transcriptional regulator of adaptative response/methylated-DNA-[protein]-cysteine methyltransferase